MNLPDETHVLPEITELCKEPLNPLQEATQSMKQPLPDITITASEHDSVAPGKTTVQDKDVQEDSDATVIYDPPELKQDNKKRIFRTVTRGIKITKRHRMYTCPQCGIKKTSIQSINEHYKGRHEEVSCKICNKTFATPNTRNKHMYIHKSRKRCVCTQCGKEFPFSSMLNDHKGQHTKDKRYPCWWPGCKKGFSYSWDLKKHIWMHKNEKKPKKCEYCDYSNPDPQNLKQHMRTHTDETPHKCKYCGKAFCFWVQKKRHQDTHVAN